MTLSLVGCISAHFLRRQENIFWLQFRSSFKRRWLKLSFNLNLFFSEAAVHGCCSNQVFLKFFRKFNRKKLSLFLIKVAGLQPATLFKKRFQHSVVLWILKIFLNNLIYKTHSLDCLFFLIAQLSIKPDIKTIFAIL